MDLRKGSVTGSSPYVKILVVPTTGQDRNTCDSQALLRIDFRGTRKLVDFTFHYGEQPKGFTFVISGCQNDYGFGGNFEYFNKNRNCASTQLVNSQLRVYSNQNRGYLKETINGHTLMKVS